MFFRSTLASVLVLSLVGTVTFPAKVARAQDEEQIRAARGKFQRGLELEQAGNYAGAVTLFRDVGQIKMTPQVRYHIATCEEKLGQLVAALGGYELALQTSEGMHPDFIRDVETSVEDLRARIPKLLIERGSGAEAAAIELDGVALGVTQIGNEMPLDPGPHTVSAKAPGFEDYSETVTVTESNVQTLSIEMSPLPEDAPVTSSATQEDEAPKGYGIWPYVIGGVGVAAAATGAILLPVSQGKAGQAEDICGGTNCDSLGDTDPAAWNEAHSLVDSAKTLETVGWISIGVGVAAIGTGVVLYLIDPTRTGESAPSDDSGPEVSWMAAAPGADAGFSLVGSF